MTRWLDPLRRALDDATAPTEVFFRDDDAGWDDDRLFALLDLFAERETPIDLAVIPNALTPRLAARLLERTHDVAVHQHGFAHVNHEPVGRKCEFGAARAKELQRRDIAEGRRRLSELLGPAVRPVFTPPWNRCTDATGECLVELGFRALSRDATATPLDTPGLAEVPIRMDWFAHRRGVRLGRDEWAARLAAEVGSARPAEPVGIMFHHAVMDDVERRATGELLDVLGAHDRVRVRTILGKEMESHGGM